MIFKNIQGYFRFFRKSQGGVKAKYWMSYILSAPYFYRPMAFGKLPEGNSPRGVLILKRVPRENSPAFYAKVISKEEKYPNVFL